MFVATKIAQYKGELRVDIICRPIIFGTTKERKTIMVINIHPFVVPSLLSVAIMTSAKREKLIIAEIMGITVASHAIILAPMNVHATRNVVAYTRSL